MPKTKIPWLIELYSPEMSNPIRIPIREAMIIGRSVEGSDKQPDIDLNPYGAERQGVSRHHIELRVDDGKLILKDLESNNGTRVNGDQVEAMVEQNIGTKASLVLGRMVVEIRLTVRATDELTLPLDMLLGSGETILIVEDDAEVSRVLTLALERIGLKTVVAHEVLGAIRTYNRVRPQAVLLDLMLPDMNGLEFCRYVRRDVSSNAVPVIVVSADSKSRREAMAAGANMFLNKPIRIGELQDTVRRILKERAGPVIPRYETRRLGATATASTPAEEESSINPDSTLVIYVAGHKDQPLNVQVDKAVSFGRQPRSGLLGKHIDLSRFGAEEQGVSRLHMFLHYTDGNLFVEDNSSTNGTFVDGERLRPHQRQEITNGAEVRLGMLRLNVYKLSEHKDD